MTDIENMSTEELEQLLAKKRKAEEDRRARAKAKYEADREAQISALMEEAEQVSLALGRLKTKANAVMTQQAIDLDNYGGLRANSKGGFSITSKDGSQRIVRRLDSEPTWDERASKGEQLIKSFLFDTVKKKDKNLFEILLSFIQRNKQGDLEYSKVFTLLQHEGKYTDERWVEGLRLLKESYTLYHKGFGYEFKVKGRDGKWENLGLNFSSI